MSADPLETITLIPGEYQTSGQCWLQVIGIDPTNTLLTEDTNDNPNINCLTAGQMIKWAAPSMSSKITNRYIGFGFDYIQVISPTSFYLYVGPTDPTNGGVTTYYAFSLLQ